MDNVVTDVFEQIRSLPADLGRKAVKQISGTQEEKAAAEAAKRRLPGLTERDLKVAAQQIAEVRQKLAEEEKKKIVQKRAEVQKKKAEMSIGQKTALQNQAETRGGAGGIG